MFFTLAPVPGTHRLTRTMKSPFPGFRGVRRKFTTTANTTKALAGILVCLGSAAYGQVVLDDFSTSDETKYNYVPVSNNPPDGWNVTAGELRPNIAGDASAAWFWNQGEKLSMVGDSVTISLSLPGEASNGLGTGIGLFLGPDTTSALGHQIREYAQGGSWSFVVDGVGLPLGSPPSGPVQLSVQM